MSAIFKFECLRTINFGINENFIILVKKSEKILFLDRCNYKIQKKFFLKNLEFLYLKK